MLGDLTLGPDADRFRAEFRSWLEGHVPREPEPTDETSRFEYLRRWQRTLAEHGWAGVAWPSEYGGRGAGPLQQFAYYEELARAEAPPTVNQPGIVLFGPTLMIHGTEDLKARYLPRMLNCEDVWCQGFSEPDAGSDLAALRTRAELKDGRFVVHGQKIWTSWATYADRCALLCRTDPEAPRHEGLSMLIVDLDQAGVEARPIVQITGEQREFGELYFDGAEVPADHIVGEPGDGWRIAMTMLQFERSDLALHDHARLAVKLDRIAERFRRATDKGRFAEATAHALRGRFADAYARCLLLRELNLGLAHRQRGGEEVGAYSSVVRMCWSGLAQAIGELGVEVAGAESPADDPLVHDFLWSRSTTIASGTAEIQRNIIADRVLGIPRG